LDINGVNANNTVTFTNAGSTFNNNGTISTNNASVGITLNGTDWAGLSGGTTGTLQAATYTVGGAGNTGYGAANNVDVQSSTTGTNQGSNTLRFNTAAAISVVISGGTKGILETANVGSNAVNISGNAGSGMSDGNRGIPIIQNNTLGDMTITSALVDGGTSGIGKAGAGRLIMAGTNTYAGPTNVNEGTLQINSLTNIGAASTATPGGSAFVMTAAPLNINGTLEVRGNMALDGVQLSTGGNSTPVAGVSGVYSHNLVVGTNNPTIDVDANHTFTISGGINANVSSQNNNNSGVLNLTGAGTVVISSTNQSDGGITVNGPTVQANFATTGVTLTGNNIVPLGLNGGLVPVIAASGQTYFTLATAQTAGPGGGPLQVGTYITGAGLPANTKITSVSGTTVSISSTTTAANSGSYNWFLNAPVLGSSFSSGVTTITVASATGIQAGEQVIGTGIRSGTVVTGVNGTTVTLSAATTAASDANVYVFGSYNQYTVSATTGISMGMATFGQGFNGYINSLDGNVLSDTNTNNGSNGFSISSVAFGAADSLGVGPLTVISGTLDLGGVTHNPIKSVTLLGGTIQNGTLYLAGSEFPYDVRNGTIAANLASNSALSVSLQKTTSGTVTLSGTNTYDGGTSLQAGQLNLNSARAIGTGALTISANTSLDSTSGNVTLTSNNVQTWNGNFTFVGTNNLNLGTGAVSLPAPITVTVNANTLTVGGNITGGNGVWDIAKAGNGTLILNSTIPALTASQVITNISGGTKVLGGNITGTGYGLTLNTAGTLLIAGASNSYTGGTTVNSGTLLVGSTSNGYSTNNNNRLGPITSTNSLTINGGVVDLGTNTTQYTYGLLITGGTIQNGTLYADAGGFTANVPAATTATISASLTNQYLGFTSNGAGTVVLSGSNTFQRDVTVNAGTLQIFSNSNLGTPFSNYYPTWSVVSVPSRLALNGVLQASGGTSFALDGFGTQAGIYARPIDLGSSPSKITVDAGTTLTVSGGFDELYYAGGSGNFVSRDASGTLTKDGAGTLIISGANQSPGGLILNAGKLQANVASGPLAGKTLAAQGLNLGLASAVASGATVVTITNATTKGLTAGQLIAGTGLPAGTTISSISGDTVTLSAAFTAASSGGYSIFANAPTTASFASGASSITVASATGIRVGQEINGTGILAGTVVTGISGTTITLNVPTIAAASGVAEYAFGGINQYLVTSAGGAAGLVPGIGSIGNGLNGTITTVFNDLVTDSGINNGNFAITGQGYNAYESLGNGSLTVNGGTLDLNGIAHQLGGRYFNPAAGSTVLALQPLTITGGTIQNGTLGALSYTATVPSLGQATVSATLVDGVTATAVTTPATLLVNGAGTLTLSAANTFSGATTLTSGTLNLSHQNALQFSTLTPNGGSLVFDSSVGGHAFTVGGLVSTLSGAGYDISLQDNASN
ncbi:MAG: autotransporter-associated beta strand repeat-containing protein, partial [Phycisphaerae bacterium]